MKRIRIVAVLMAVILVLCLFASCAGDTKEIGVDDITIDFMRGARLEDVPLPNGYKWVDGTEVVKLGTHTYKAIYSESNKNTSVDVKITMNKSESMLREDESMEYLINRLRSDEFALAEGSGYESNYYDQAVMILARSQKGLPDDIKAAYLERVKVIVNKYVDPVTNKVLNGEGWSMVNYSDSMVLALMAIGEDTTQNGVDLLAPYYDETLTIEGKSIYEIVNSVNIVKNIEEFPETYKTFDGAEHRTSVSHDKIIDAVIAMELPGGGWSWGDTMDIDATSMAISAIAEFYNERSDVKTAVDKAVAMLKETVGENGGIVNFGQENVNSTATTMTAVTSIGIDVTEFAADGKTIYDFLESRRITEGENKGAYWLSNSSSVNDLATKDILIALVNYNRMLLGQANVTDII